MKLEKYEKDKIFNALLENYVLANRKIKECREFMLVLPESVHGYALARNEEEKIRTHERLLGYLGCTSMDRKGCKKCEECMSLELDKLIDKIILSGRVYD